MTRANGFFLILSGLYTSVLRRTLSETGWARRVNSNQWATALLRHVFAFQSPCVTSSRRKICLYRWSARPTMACPSMMSFTVDGRLRRSCWEPNFDGYVSPWTSPGNVQTAQYGEMIKAHACFKMLPVEKVHILNAFKSKNKYFMNISSYFSITAAVVSVCTRCDSLNLWD